jgi:hypothetical protein
VAPRPLQQMPKLLPQDEAYYGFFQTLSESRTYGLGGPDALRISEVLALCQLTGIAYPAEKSKYLRIVQRLDRVYLTHWSKQPKQA